jgi:hypothetical protein
MLASLHQSPPAGCQKNSLDCHTMPLSTQVTTQNHRLSCIAGPQNVSSTVPHSSKMLFTIVPAFSAQVLPASADASACYKARPVYAALKHHTNTHLKRRQPVPHERCDSWKWDPGCQWLLLEAFEIPPSALATPAVPYGADRTQQQQQQCLYVLDSITSACQPILASPQTCDCCC